VKKGCSVQMMMKMMSEGAAIDLYIYGLVVSSDGNLLDALAAAIKVR